MQANPDLNAKNEDGETPLHSMATMKFVNVNTLKLFFKMVANMNERTATDNDTAFSLLIGSMSFSTESDEDRILLQDSAKFLIECTDVNLVDANRKNIISNILELSESLEYRKYFYKIIIEHVAKLIALDQHVDSSLLSTIYCNNNYNIYYTICEQELEKAKNTKLHMCWVTFFNLLVDDKPKLVKYAGNGNLIQDFEKNVNEFPVYGSVMKKNVSKGINSRRLFNVATSVLSNSCPIFDPTHLILKDVLDVMEKKDWKKLNDFKRAFSMTT